MNILQFFQQLVKETELEQPTKDIRSVGIYVEDRRYKDFHIKFHMMSTTQRKDGVIVETGCTYEPCCFYKGKLGKLQVANLTTGKYEIFDITKHDIDEELQGKIRKIVVDSIEHWKNSYEFLKGPKHFVKYDNMFEACY